MAVFCAFCFGGFCTAIIWLKGFWCLACKWKSEWISQVYEYLWWLYFFSFMWKSSFKDKVCITELSLKELKDNTIKIQLQDILQWIRCNLQESCPFSGFFTTNGKGVRNSLFYYFRFAFVGHSTILKFWIIYIFIFALFGLMHFLTNKKEKKWTCIPQ